MIVRLYKESPEGFFQHQYKPRFIKYGIADDIFYKLYKADPTSTEQAKGIFTTWIVDQYLDLIKNGKDKEAKRMVGEDLYKFTDDLKLFVDLKKKKLIANDVDIKQFKDINELHKFLTTYLTINEPTAKKVSKDPEIDLMFNQDGWTVEIPKSFEASKKLCGTANWCTKKLDSYQHYTKQGPLIIIKHGRTKWQFHMKSGQWADSNDEMMNLYKWMRDEKVPESLKQFLINMDEKKMKVLKTDLKKVKNINGADIVENEDGSISVLSI